MRWSGRMAPSSPAPVRPSGCWHRRPRMRIALPVLLILRLACAILLSAGLAVGQVAAQSPSLPVPANEGAAVRARHLDALFAHLKTATVEEEADAMVAEIWKLWLQSGR